MSNNERVILVVDDSRLVLEKIIGILEEAIKGVEILKAGNYTEALHIVNDQKPNLVLLDINLPGKNGLELLRDIKRNYPHIKVLMLSNWAGEEYKRISKSFGCDYFLDKSHDFEKMPETVKQILSEDFL